jgi:N,N-dimethylformamidase
VEGAGIVIFESLEVNNKRNSLRTFWIKYMPESIKNRTKKLLRNKFPITIDDSPSNYQFNRLSIYRPHPNCSIEEEDPHKPFTNHLAESEWRLLAWLEKNNFNYDLVSGFELHKNPSLLKNYSVFILNSHSEYWSKEMYKGLKEYFYSGGSILNLSGNSIYREVEFLADGSIRCVSLRFSESADDESEVIGVRFDMRGYGTCAPYKVLIPDHWVFTRLNVNKGDIFGKKSLNQPTTDSQKKFESNPASSPGLTKLTGNGASGWETDKITKTAPKDFTLIAKGMNGKKGGADMIVRERTNDHGLLFSASSITFVGSLAVDKISSGIVKNVLQKVLD